MIVCRAPEKELCSTDLLWAPVEVPRFCKLDGWKITAAVFLHAVINADALLILNDFRNLRIVTKMSRKVWSERTRPTRLLHLRPNRVPSHGGRPLAGFSKARFKRLPLNQGAERFFSESC